MEAKVVDLIPDVELADVELADMKISFEKTDVSTIFPDDESSDVAFIVEGKKIFVSKAVISVISPVFRAMFVSDFKEKTCSEISLPGKTAEEMEEFFGVIYPTIMKPLKECDTIRLLKLANEYQVASVTKRCTEYLTRKCKQKGRAIPLGELLQMLLAAELYDLPVLEESVLLLLSNQFYSDLEGISVFKDLSGRMREKIMKTRLNTLESIYKNGKMLDVIRNLAPCRKRHRITTECLKCYASVKDDFNCTDHQNSQSYAALDSLLCHSLQCAPLNQWTTVDWVKFAKDTGCPRALKMIQESEISQRSSEILKQI